MKFKKILGYFLVTFLSLSLLTGCGKSDKEAKELLTRLLQIVGIPYDIVVNICQDGNNNGLCEAYELQTKVTINKGDSVETILSKVKLTEDGKYLLEHYDPTKKILMEIEDNEALNNSGQKVTLSYEPKDIETLPVQELSILQSLIDNNLIKEEEVTKLKESKVRPKVDAILLENLFENQKILVENNMTTVDARDRNLEYIAEGLRDINVSGNLVENLQSCENNNSCEETILQDANEQTQIDKKEAQVIAETNSTEGTGDKDTSLTTEENNTTTQSSDSNTTTPPADNNTSDGNTTSTSDNNTSDETTIDPVNNPPTANAGADQTITEGESVTLNASNSTGDITDYSWKEDGTLLSNNVSFSKNNFSIGTHTILLEVKESDGDTDTDTVTITVNEATNSTNKQVADGYIIKLLSPATATCNNAQEYNSSMSVGEKGRILFDTVLTPDCNITIASGTIIDSNNNGIYDAGIDKELQFSMKAPADATYISPLTTLLMVKLEKGEDVSTLKNMVKDFDPVSAISKVQNGTASNIEESKKLISLMEILKSSMESNASADNLNDINISSVTDTNIDFKDFNISTCIANLPANLKEKAIAKATLIKNIIELLKSIDSNIIDMETLGVAISDGGMTLQDAFKISIRSSVSNSIRSNIENSNDFTTILRNVIKNSYGSSKRDTIFSYFQMLNNNINKFHQHNFNFGNIDINASMLITRDLTIDNIDELEGVYKVTSLDMLDNQYNNVDYKNYDARYQKNDSLEVDNSFHIKVNQVSKFEIINGLDSNLFRISRGNRKIAYLDLKDGLSSPTTDSVEDVNHDGVYEVEVKITDVQTLQTRNIVLKFGIVDESKKDIFANPVRTTTGYINRDASIGGLVLDNRYNNDNSWTANYPKSIYQLISIDNVDIASIKLVGDGSDDFEIVDNEKIKVTSLLDYDTKQTYNLTVVANTNSGQEYNSSITINVSDYNRTIEFSNRELLEKVSKRTPIDDYDYFHLYNNNPARFKIENGLDGGFFELSKDRYNYDSNISSYSGLYLKRDVNLSDLTHNDANGDGIYEVNITATDVQTLKSSSIVLKYKPVSSYLSFDRYNNSYGREDRNDFSVNQETVVGGEVPNTLFHIDKAKDVNITDIHLEGDGNTDFNITNSAITVVNGLDASIKDLYNLKLISTDTTGYRQENNITIHINQGYTHNDFNITNSNELYLNQYFVNWYDSYSSYINTNNIARMRFIGDDVLAVDIKWFNRYYTRHSTYFSFYRNHYSYNNNEFPSYLNPKDKNGDNIYQFQVELIDIQTLEKQRLDYSWEMLSHMVMPYESNNLDYNEVRQYYSTKSHEVNLTIPSQAPIGGELLTSDGAKGFYVEFGRDINFDSARLTGLNANKFAIVDSNTIQLKELVSDGDYNLTLLIKDSEGVELSDSLNIHVGTPISNNTLKPSNYNKLSKLSKTSKPSKTKVKSKQPSLDMRDPYYRERLFQYEMYRRRVEMQRD